MRAVVVYESMFGNTHAVADAIAEGLRSAVVPADIAVVAVSEAAPEMVEEADLVVVGGPTHIHGMSRPTSRAAAPEMVDKAKGDLTLDPAAAGPGVREWFESIGASEAKAAAFDTRMPGPAAVTGRAAKGIDRRLRHHGFEVVARAESFIVDHANHLQPGELERARRWGASLVDRLSA